MTDKPANRPTDHPTNMSGQREPTLPIIDGHISHKCRKEFFHLWFLFKVDERGGQRPFRMRSWRGIAGQLECLRAGQFSPYAVAAIFYFVSERINDELKILEFFLSMFTSKYADISLAKLFFTFFLPFKFKIRLSPFHSHYTYVIFLRVKFGSRTRSWLSSAFKGHSSKPQVHL